MSPPKGIIVNLTIEVHLGEWVVAGAIAVNAPEKGYLGGTATEYDLPYFAGYASVDFQTAPVVDWRAFSVDFPVDLERRERKTWPPFLLDLMPQGHARRRLAEHLKLDVDARAADLPLLLRAAGNPIGNIRIREAAEEEHARLEGIVRLGVTDADIFERSDRFDEVVDRFGMLASGSSGLQGEWPKVALTRARDGLFYPDTMVEDHEAMEHVIVKLLRSNSPADRTILEGEAIYARIAGAIGLNVYAPSIHQNGVLMIPRFDRRVVDGTVQRLGQESLVSALGVADFGHIDKHEAYVSVIRRFSHAPYEDVLEYVKRDAASLAMGDPDNHGRNTAFSKDVDGTIRLSPLFDFAPMKLADDGIVRSTRWAAMQPQHSDHRPSWSDVCDTIFADDPASAARLKDDLRSFADSLEAVPAMAKDLGAGDTILNRAVARCEEIVGDLRAIELTKATVPGAR